MRRLGTIVVAFSMVSMLIARAGTLRAEPGPPADETATPEAALRTFMVAVLLQDAATFERVCLPTTKRELAWLTRGQSPAQAGVTPEVVRGQLQKLAITQLKVGDEVVLPGGEKHIVPWDDVGPDRAVVRATGDPMPTRSFRLQGRWRVDPGPMIAARKVADSLQRKRDNKPPAAEAPEPPSEDTASPEAALRAFWASFFRKDEARLLRVTQPTAANQLAWLLAGPVLPRETQDRLIGQNGALEIVALKVGDQVRLGGQVQTLSEKDVGPDNAVLHFENDPVLFRVSRSEDGWRVDPQEIIARRKALRREKEDAPK